MSTTSTATGLPSAERRGRPRRRAVAFGVEHDALGRAGRDQVEDYARRKGWTLEEAERWLAPNLAYRPEGAAAVGVARG